MADACEEYQSEQETVELVRKVKLQVRMVKRQVRIVKG